MNDFLNELRNDNLKMVDQAWEETRQWRVNSEETSWKV